MTSNTNPLLFRRLYRSLLKASKPFSNPSPHASVVTCLLHRSGTGDGFDLEKYFAESRISTALRSSSSVKKEAAADGEGRSLVEARNLSKSYANIPEKPKTELSLDQRRAPVRVYFRMLLRDVMAGPNGAAQMLFPSQVDTTRLRNIIKREFRLVDCSFDLETRKEVGFVALRELNTKLSWLATMDLPEPETQTLCNQRQAARNVYPLPLDPALYLKPGTFLIANPHLGGFFRQSVVCIVDHTERNVSPCDNEEKIFHGGTYGLTVNKPCLNPSTGRDQTLRDAFRQLPKKIADSFGDCSIRHGGPVHLSLQMLHGARPLNQPTIKGKVLRMRVDEHTDETVNTDREVYYQGDVIEAANAVTLGELDRDDISFYVGASCWEVGQLESEIQQGFWLPCRGPPEIALIGACDHVGDDEVYAKETERPKADLWLSLLCAMGNDEATLAHLFSKDESHECDDVCDNF